MYLPLQAKPVARKLFVPAEMPGLGGAGVTASQSSCDYLTGLARQMCYSTEYGASV